MTGHAWHKVDDRDARVLHRFRPAPSPMPGPNGPNAASNSFYGHLTHGIMDTVQLS
ncbi:MAG: hypothetical protein HOI95_18035 [Chromatiales bacterium]|nr:hypothetical protein [Chromatiales bacterium]